MPGKWYDGFGRYRRSTGTTDATNTTVNPSDKPLAEKPFNDPSKCDYILRSSDAVDFYILRAPLHLASPIFVDMFDLSQPLTSGSSKPPANKAPIIDLSEDAETLDALLRCVYPIHDPVIKSIDLAYKLTQAVEKYLVSKSCLSPIYSLLRDEIPVAGEPIKAYALAWRLGLREAAMFTSRYTFETDLTLPGVKEQLLNISGDPEALLALHELRSSQTEALDKALAEATLRHSRITLCSSCRSSDLRFERLRKALRLAFHQAGGYSHPTGTAGDIEVAVNLTKVLVATCGTGCKTPAAAGSLGQNALIMVKAPSHEINWPANKPSI